MANPHQLKRLGQGIAAWEQWREEHPEVEVDLRAADLRQADLREADLHQAALNMANLGEASLRRTNLSAAVLIGADLRGADLRGALARHGDFTGANLKEADLRGADLRGADLSDAGLVRANLGEARLANASLKGTDLRGTILSGANLCAADISNSKLHGASFVRAKLTGANFSGAVAGWTTFDNLDLGQATGLDEIHHEGPSSIGVDTLYLSGDRIPAEFLQRAGMPQSLIAHLPALLEAPDGATFFYSCFVSHSTKDHSFCKALHSRMTEEGLRAWFAPKDMKGGKKLHGQVARAIRVNDKLLLVLSEASMASEWVAREIRLAIRRERKEGTRILFPISLVPFSRIEEWEGIYDKALSGKDLTDEVREYFIPDFSNWQDAAAFEAAFSRLLKDLQKPNP